MTHDPLLSAKLKFFDLVSGKLNEFLRGFQTNKSMVPFIAEILGDLIRNFFGRIIVKDILKKKSNLYNLIQIDPLDNNIRKNQEKKTQLGFAAKRKLEQIKSSLNSTKILDFKKQAGEFLAKLLHHFLEQSSLKYALVRSALCPNPMYMRNLAKKSSCESHMDTLLQKLASLGRISGGSAELVKKQCLNCFVLIDQKQQLFSSFDPTNNRVDTLFYETTGSSNG